MTPHSAISVICFWITVLKIAIYSRIEEKEVNVMDMYQKREKRKNKSQDKSVKLNINWFPGHMTKAKREMQEKLKLVDMVIECRDARIPLSSANPLLDELIHQKPRIILLTKIDKADPLYTKAWINHLKNETTEVIGVDVLNDNVVQIITSAAQICMKPMIERQKRRGINPRAIRAMVVGIPNVGKSTLINRIAKRRATIAADKPGVTRALQWVKVNKELELLDTPGVLWPKFDDEHVGMRLAISGAIRDEILPIDEVAVFAMKYLIAHYPEQITERYQIEVCDDPHLMFERIAQVRKFIKSNQELDIERTIQRFIRDVRDDYVGRITWEYLNEDRQ